MCVCGWVAWVCAVTMPSAGRSLLTTVSSRLIQGKHLIKPLMVSEEASNIHVCYFCVFRLLQTLKCTVCLITTRRGDIMANHLTERPDHHCVVLTHTGAVKLLLTVFTEQLIISCCHALTLIFLMCVSGVSVNGGNVTGAQSAETCRCVTDPLLICY